MTDNFDIEQFIEHYIKNIRAMQQLTDKQIRDVMMHKIVQNPEYFEIISDVSQKIDNQKLIKQVLDTQDTLATDHVPIEPDKFIGRKIA